MQEVLSCALLEELPTNSCKLSGVLCMVDYVLFQTQLEAVAESREDISEGRNALICDAPNNTSQISELSNSEYVRLALQDITHFVMFLFSLAHLGMQTQKFCSAGQLKTWYEMLIGRGRKFGNGKEVGSVEPPPRRRLVVKCRKRHFITGYPYESTVMTLDGSCCSANMLHSGHLLLVE